MRQRAARTLPAFALVLAVGVTVGGCTAASATGMSASAASGTSSAAARASDPVYGPPAPDPACVAARKAEQTLAARQGNDQNNESALDQDFTDFANALNAAAQRETHPATAKAMTALAADYTDLVESQSGAAQLPDMDTVEADGTAFEKACSLSGPVPPAGAGRASCARRDASAPGITDLGQVNPLVLPYIWTLLVNPVPFAGRPPATRGRARYSRFCTRPG
jgi:hypothetical protein